MAPQNISLFCVGVAKACYVSPKSKKIACVLHYLLLLVVPTALVLGSLYQGPFIVARAANTQRANEL